MNKEYNLVFIQYQENKFVETNCLDIEFRNLGSSDVYINNFPLSKGQSIKFEGKNAVIDEIIKEPIYINFALEIAQRNLWVIKRVRVNH